MKTQSAVTSNRNMFVIKQIFKHGEELHAIVENPSKGIRYLSKRLMREPGPHEIESLVFASRTSRASSICQP